MNEPLASERIIIEAPMSFTGSARRIWRLTYLSDATWARIVLIALAVALIIPSAWIVVLCWYCTFGLLLVPYRLIRRSSRKQKRDALRHRELIGR